MAADISSTATIEAAFARLRSARDEVTRLRFDALTAPERLTLLEELEHDRRRQPTAEHELIHGLVAGSSPEALGAKKWSDVLEQRLRISAGDARRRLDEAADLGPRTALTGEALEPQLPNVAKRQAGGEIGADHVRIIRKFFRSLPAAVDYQTRTCCEDTLARLAAEHTPDGLRKAADRLAAYVNPDGEFSDVDRACKRGLTIGRQRSDGMSEVRGCLDPEGRATLDAVLAKLAAPGMCNPDDQDPCIDEKPDDETVRRDHRTQAQRNHDALKAMGPALLASGKLGQHNGLPASIIVTTTLRELKSGIGTAVTGGGSVLPMRDVIRLAGQSNHYLAIFDDHTEVPLYLGRAKRLASRGQRIVLYARDRGCSKPGCTIPATGVRCTISTTGPTAGTPTSSTSRWHVGRTTGSSTTETGPHGWAKTVVRNGFHRRIWTAVNRG